MANNLGIDNQLIFNELNYDGELLIEEVSKLKSTLRNELEQAYLAIIDSISQKISKFFSIYSCGGTWSTYDVGRWSYQSRFNKAQKEAPGGRSPGRQGKSTKERGDRLVDCPTKTPEQSTGRSPGQSDRIRCKTREPRLNLVARSIGHAQQRQWSTTWSTARRETVQF